MSPLQTGWSSFVLRTQALAVAGTGGIAFEPDAFSVPAGEDVGVDPSSGMAVLHDLVLAEAGAAAAASATGEPVGPIGDNNVFVVVAGAGETATARTAWSRP